MKYLVNKFAPEEITKLNETGETAFHVSVGEKTYTKFGPEEYVFDTLAIAKKFCGFLLDELEKNYNVLLGQQAAVLQNKIDEIASKRNNLSNIS